VFFYFKIMVYIFEIIIGVLVIYLAFNGFYLFFFAVCSLFTNKKVIKENNYLNKFAVLIIAYKNDQVILESAVENLNQTYAKDKFDIIVVGDHLEPETVNQLKKLPIKVIAFDLSYSTKGNSVLKTESLIREGDYDFIVLLDIDNVMEADYLIKLNNEITEGIQVIQTHRIAKNLDTSIAILDALSEEINNSIFRLGHVNIGLQTALIGSGIAIRKDFFLNQVLTIRAVGGYDKEMELIMALDKTKTKYTPNIEVYDEKTRFIDDLNKQRTRWFSAQFFYLRKNLFKSLISLLINSNLNYFNKTLQLLLMPKVLVLGFAFLLPILTYFIDYDDFKYLFPISLLSFFAVLFSAIIALPLKYFKLEYFFAFKKLPIVFVTLLKSLTNLKGANRNFIATPHHTNKKK
jgi:cellulose synthase/poly-beta-1,6-N-acetylglucosamine synthase-like glycosyltransferase